LREKRKRTKRSLAKRNFCLKCGSALWLCDPRWPELINPHAPAIDTPLPKPPANAIRQLHCFAHYQEFDFIWSNQSWSQDSSLIDHREVQIFIDPRPILLFSFDSWRKQSGAKSFRYGGKAV
jgi:hypothetical protein